MLRRREPAAATTVMLMAYGNTDQASGAGALRRSEERFRLLVASVVDYAIYMLDPDGVIESWNVGAQRLKGYDEHEVIGRHYSTFYTPEDRDAELPARLLAEARANGTAKHSGWRVRKDGSRFWADVVITAIHDGAGRHTGFAKVTRDMTDAYLGNRARERALASQQRAVARLEELDHWRVDFIASMAHDLQTPVTAISGFAELLLSPKSADDEDRAVFLEQIRSNARSLQEMIDNLRAHARLSERSADLARDRVGLDRFINRLIWDMGPLFGDRPVVPEVADVEISVDPQALERILRNLLSNAARHTPPGTPIHLRAHLDADTAVFEVHDEGYGIPDELLPRIFGRFESGNQGGTGLGLSIAKRYVELHGGDISAHSDADTGATFRFTIPQPAATTHRPDTGG